MDNQAPIRVAVVGSAGRMGRECLRSLQADADFEVLLAIDKDQVGRNCRELAGADAPDIVIESKLGQALDRVPVDILLDFSHHTAAPSHVSSASKRKVSSVVGCTGLTESDLGEMRAICQETGVPAMYVPNFAIGAVLMMHFSELAARWMPNVEIIEMHHDQKEDAPSGTAILTAQRIKEGRFRAPSPPLLPVEKVQGARGGRYLDVQIHSVRLPGLLAHQQVLFGSIGEVLTVRHDSLNRSSFMGGVKLALYRVRSLTGLVEGLDSILLGKA